MKIPDTTKIENYLRRTLDPDTFNRIVYFEECVLADSISLESKGYEIFVITQDQLLHVPMGGKGKAPRGVRLASLEMVEVLNDSASFFEDAIAVFSQHIRAKMDDTAADTDVDFYTFYEDSKIFHYLWGSWIHARQRTVFPQLFSPIMKTKNNLLDALTGPASATLLRDLVRQVAIYKASAPRMLPLFEELTVGVCESVEFKKACFEDNDVLDFVGEELMRNVDLAEYAGAADPRDLLRARDAEVMTEVSQIDFVITLLTFFSKLISGSEMHAQRMALTFSGDPSRRASFLNALLLLDPQSTGRSATAERHLKMLRAQRERQEAAAAAHNDGRLEDGGGGGGGGGDDMDPGHNLDDRAQSEAIRSLQRQAAELDHARVEAFFHMLQLFNFSLVYNLPGINLETFYQHVMTLDEFKTRIVPQWVNRLGALLREPQAPNPGWFVFCYAYVCHRVIARSREIRQSVQTECAVLLKYELGNEETLAQLRKSPIFFYRLSALYLKQLLDEVKKMA